MTEVLELPTVEDNSELLAVCAVFDSEAWKKHLVPYLDELVDEALGDVRNAVYATPDIKGHLATRWQQREAVVTAIKQFAQEKLNARSALNAEPEEAFEHQRYSPYS